MLKGEENPGSEGGGGWRGGYKETRFFVQRMHFAPEKHLLTGRPTRARGQKPGFRAAV
jgi:hypothetical protein